MPLPPTNSSGLREFWEIITDIHNVGSWMVKGVLVVPLVDVITAIGPPWPPGIVFITPIVEVVALIYIFEYWWPEAWDKAKVEAFYRRRMRGALAIIILSLTLYILLLAFLSYSPPWERNRFAKGFSLTPTAQVGVDSGISPDTILRQNNWDPTTVWTSSSIHVTEIAFLLTWLLFFVSLSLYVGTFVLAQRRSESSRR
jgi:hypothetical protein